MITIYLEFNTYEEKNKKYIKLSKQGFHLDFQDFNSKTNKYQLFMSKKIGDNL